MSKLSQTTGYAAKSIYLTQYSTAGQHLVASSGSEIDIEGGAELEIASGGLVDMDGELEVGSGGLVELKSGSTMEFESGSCLKLTSGARFTRQDFEVITSSKATLSVQGISVIKSTVKGDYNIPQPYPGCQKTVIFANPKTTATAKVQLSLTTEGAECYLGTSNFGALGGKITCINLKSSDNGTLENLSPSFSLLAISTAQWLLTAMVGKLVDTHTSNFGKGFTFTTST